MISVIGSQQLRDFLNGLPNNDPLKKDINNVLDILKQRPDNGDLIPRKLWPEAYKVMNLRNLFREEVGGSGARLTYTLIINGNQVEVRIIELFRTHAEYDRRFGYS